MSQSLLALRAGKFFAVQRDSHGIRGMFENPRGAVALVHVAVEDQHPADPSGFQQVMADHRQVVEDAEARRVVVVGVMGATCQVTGQAMLQGLFGGQQRATDGAHGAPGQGFVPGQAEAPLVFPRQLAGHIAFDIPRVVGQGENFPGAQLRAQQVGIAGQATVHQVVAQQAKLVHGEAVLRRELRAVVFVVDQRQWHGNFM